MNLIKTRKEGVDHRLQEGKRLLLQVQKTLNQRKESSRSANNSRSSNNLI
jgi:hypothetical protein